MTAWRFLFISLVIHLIWLFVFDRLAYLRSQQPKFEPVVIEIVDHGPKNRGRQIVKPNLKDLVPKNRPPPKFLSERDQFVNKETSAPLSDSQSRNNAPQKLGLRDLKPTIQNPSQNPTVTANEGAVPMMAAPIVPQNLSGQEYVQDVAKGAITALNAERFTFYSFFQRIEEKVYPLWTRRARGALNALSRDEIYRLRNKELVTQAEILVDAKGNYVATNIFKSSGIPNLDAAAELAFKEAAQFYNPPKEMIKDDGYIHLYWAFIVYMGPG